MKKLLFVFCLLFCMVSMQGAGQVTVKISMGITNTSIKTKMENSMSKLFSEINAAAQGHRNLNFSNMNLNESVKTSLRLMWESSPFIITDNAIVEKGLNTSKGYQVRNIPLMMKPLPNSGFTDDEYPYAAVNFDKNGNITSFRLTVQQHQFEDILKAGKKLDDLRRRQLILDYVEQFRTSYNLKDKKFLSQIFSDDALIITGVVIRQSKDNIKLPEKVVMKKYTKAEYLKTLFQAFDSGKQIRVTFDQVEIMRHPNNPNLYGVTLLQGWTSRNFRGKNVYHDKGYVFLYWDFTNEENPKIMVRTWQPEEFTKKNEVINLSDFDIK